jgi:osmoprotectant transport system permease protein
MSIWDHFRHFIGSVFGWLTTSANWHGSSGIPQLLWHQTELSIAVVFGATLIGGGTGVILGHFGRGGLVAVNAANAARAVPTLALLTLFAIIPAISLRDGGFIAAFLALVVLAIPPILTNTYVGVNGVDPEVRDAAKAMGLTATEILSRVELPLAAPFIVAGIRTATIEVIATSTLAAYVSFSDLGTPVIAGLNTNDTTEAFAGAILVGLLATVAAVGLGIVQRLLTPRHQRTQKRARLGVSAGSVAARPALET